MHPTLVRLSKASRRPLTPKRGNKDYYKGTRQAFLPGGWRTGAPGVHTKKGYRLVDEQARVFVAPPLAILNGTLLRPYVAASVVPPKTQFTMALTPERYYASVTQASRKASHSSSSSRASASSSETDALTQEDPKDPLDLEPLLDEAGETVVDADRFTVARSQKLLLDPLGRRTRPDEISGDLWLHDGDGQPIYAPMGQKLYFSPPNEYFVLDGEGDPVGVDAQGGPVSVDTQRNAVQAEKEGEAEDEDGKARRLEIWDETDEKGASRKDRLADADGRAFWRGNRAQAESSKLEVRRGLKEGEIVVTERKPEGKEP